MKVPPLHALARLFHRSGPHAGLVSFCALGLLASSGCSGVGDDIVTSTDIVLSPTVVLVPDGLVTQSALNSSEERPASFVMVVESDEMLPRYPQGTALVVEPTDYKLLRKGMTVAYRDIIGRVAHVLVAKTAGGWVTRALNAKQDDPAPMTEANYLGTVTMAFAADRTGSR